MIRAVIHPLSDQPLVVDVDELPTAADIGLLCRNVRTIDGKRPKFIDRKDSIFIFPFSAMRFVEFYTGTGVEATEAEPEQEDLEIDEDFLRRVREA